jgi:hypothetical protein
MFGNHQFFGLSIHVFHVLWSPFSPSLIGMCYNFHDQSFCILLLLNKSSNSLSLSLYFSLSLLDSLGFLTFIPMVSAATDLLNVFEVFLPQLLLYPNPSHPFNGDAGALLMKDRKQYDQKVKGENLITI